VCAKVFSAARCHETESRARPRSAKRMLDSFPYRIDFGNNCTEFLLFWVLFYGLDWASVLLCYFRDSEKHGKGLRRIAKSSTVQWS